jgi:hypothetical protein
VTDAPCVLDVEASGFGRDSYPIEVGVVMPDGRAICTLIRPEPGWTHWDTEAESLHGITRDVACRHGRPALEVARLLNDTLDGQVVYSDGWMNDYAWLATLFDAAAMRPRFRLQHLRVLLDDAQADRPAVVRREVLDELALQRHRASTDARVLQLTVQRLRGQAQAAQPAAR